MAFSKVNERIDSIDGHAKLPGSMQALLQVADGGIRLMARLVGNAHIQRRQADAWQIAVRFGKLQCRLIEADSFCIGAQLGIHKPDRQLCLVFFFRIF